VKMQSTALDLHCHEKQSSELLVSNGSVRLRSGEPVLSTFSMGYHLLPDASSGITERETPENGS
jgi:hypothetical protein